MKSLSDSAARPEAANEIDLRALGAALKRRRRAIIVPTLLAFVLVSIFVNVVKPRYTAESEVLLENQETFFTRSDPANTQSDQTSALDPEAVASQVALINSRDIARRAIKQLQLAGNPEFDPLAAGLGPLSRVLVLLGVVPDPTRESAEARIVTKFLDKLTVYSPPKTRVIVIQFTSRDAELASRAANTIADLYLREKAAAKRATAKRFAEALAAQIADLRTKLAAADSDREQYRLQSGLLAGSNNMTISGQQLADINSDLSKARTSQAEAQAKASMIRDLLRDGKASDLTDVLNNDIVRRVSDNRILAQAQLARESRTLLPQHPRIKELTAQLAEYDAALKTAARQAATTLENEAKIARQRVANLEMVLMQQKKVAGVANTDEVHLRALERVAQTYKEQLEASSIKYEEAVARESSTATPADARVISTAGRPQEPSYPKKVPFIAFGTIAAFVLSAGFVAASELLSGHPSVAPQTMPRRPSEPAPKSNVPADRSRRVAPAAGSKGQSDTAADIVFAAVEPEAQAPSAEEGATATGGGLAATAFAYLKAFGRSAEAARVQRANLADKVKAKPPSVDWVRDDEAAKPVDADEAAGSVDIPALVERIVAAHVPGRGLHIVATDLGKESGLKILIDLGRTLSSKGRAIIVDLNAKPARLTVLAKADDAESDIATMHGLAELLAGDSSFAEVIHKDGDSRLHFIPTGLQEADFRDFDLILDALSETYDFIVLLTPAYPESEIAKVMAPYADFMLLAAIEAPDNTAMADLERELTEAGAREVLVAGPSISATRKVA